jgi:hypothetical protein
MTASPNEVLKTRASPPTSDTAATQPHKIQGERAETSKTSPMPPTTNPATNAADATKHVVLAPRTNVASTRRRRNRLTAWITRVGIKGQAYGTALGLETLLIFYRGLA